MNFSKYQFRQGSSVSDYPSDDDGGLSKEQIKTLRDDYQDQLAAWQEKLYAESEQSLLVVLQAMDAAGKDSSIARLTENLNAQGCLITSFKKPTKKELSHDFLWRVHKRAPAQGEIGIFNRSHYEDVLIVKVHGWASEKQINNRYQHINAFESLLTDRGTRVLKFMLNISPEYQLKRFQRRLDNKEKNWKFNPGDLDERKHWHTYMSAFSAAMNQCSHDRSPWYVVPAENRRFRDLMLAGVICQTLADMNPDYPEPSFDSDAFRSDTIV